jgi:hypothetical protein
MEMSWIETTLTHLEARLRSMIEGNPGGDGIPRKFHNQLLRALVQAMHAGAKMDGSDLDGQAVIAPDQYTLVLPSDQARILLTHPAELDRLAHQLESTARQSNLLLTASPMLRIVADPNAQRLQVHCLHSQVGLGDSHTVELEEIPDKQGTSPSEMMPIAFLIVNGLSTYPITQSVTNIGRDPANHLVLEKPGVSRVHAQLRYVTDHYVIFDLDSVGGTFVNGVAVSNHALSPGDVILLAGVPLVFGQEATPRLGYTQELPTEPPPIEVL